MSDRILAAAQSVFERGEAPSDVLDGDRYCRALQLTWEVADATSKRRRTSSVVEDGSGLTLVEHFGPAQRQLILRRRLDVSESDGAISFEIDGYPLTRYVRWFASADGRLEGVAFAHEHHWKINAVVFDSGADAGGLLTECSGVGMLHINVESMFGAFGTLGGYPLQRPDHKRVWDILCGRVPLAPRGIDCISVLGDGDAVLLEPTNEPEWNSYELADFLQFPDPSIVDLEFVGADNGGDVEISIALHAPGPELTAGVQDVVVNWRNYWISDDAGALALRVDPADSLHIVGPAGLLLVASVHDLGIRLAPKLRRFNATASVLASSL